MAEMGNQADLSVNNKGFKAWWRRLRAKLRLPTDPKLRRRRIILASVVGIIIVGAAAGLAVQLANTNSQDQGQLNFSDVAKKLTGNLVTSNLDGLQYSADVANRRPIGVMVENHPQARPQFGLTRASVIYEAIAEGGITRYLLIFGPQDAERVGPIRSARTYYIDWDLEYNGIYAHAGGAANALAKLHSDSTINQIDTAGQPVMWRQRRGNEASEHTLYGNTVEMRNYSKDVGWETEQADFTPWTFKVDGRSEAERKNDATVASISIPYSGSYKVQYNYNATNSNWERILAGEADIDALTNQQITPTNIIVEYMSRSEIVSAGKTVGDLDLYSGGKAIVFTGGKEIDGTWEKAGERKRTKFLDENGQEVTLTAGQTMVEVLQPGMDVTTTAPATTSSTDSSTTN